MPSLIGVTIQYMSWIMYSRTGRHSTWNIVIRVIRHLKNFSITKSPPHASHGEKLWNKTWFIGCHVWIVANWICSPATPVNLASRPLSVPFPSSVLYLFVCIHECRVSEKRRCCISKVVQKRKPWELRKTSAELPHSRCKHDTIPHNMHDVWAITHKTFSLCK